MVICACAAGSVSKTWYDAVGLTGHFVPSGSRTQAIPRTSSIRDIEDDMSKDKKPGLRDRMTQAESRLFLADMTLAAVDRVLVEKGIIEDGELASRIREKIEEAAAIAAASFASAGVDPDVPDSADGGEDGGDDKGPDTAEAE
jgi:hypothetical protein